MRSEVGADEEETTCRDRRPLIADARTETTGPFHTDGGHGADVSSTTDPRGRSPGVCRAHAGGALEPRPVPGVPGGPIPGPIGSVTL
jgi:hypothetical protein